MVVAMNVTLTIVFILSIAGGITLYFTFLAKRNENKFKGFLGWVYDFLLFKKLFSENLLKVLYLILAIFTTLASIVMIPFSSFGFLIALLFIVIGNVLLRIAYEFLLVKLLICRNTTEINEKLSKNKE